MGPECVVLRKLALILRLRTHEVEERINRIGVGTLEAIVRLDPSENAVFGTDCNVQAAGVERFRYAES